ncbi:hypothetical protein Hdeb2414_s0002g00049761 [Helianthus debilis subsp. tardiflorus]
MFFVSGVLSVDDFVDYVCLNYYSRQLSHQPFQVIVIVLIHYSGVLYDRVLIE